MYCTDVLCCTQFRIGIKLEGPVWKCLKNWGARPYGRYASNDWWMARSCQMPSAAKAEEWQKRSGGRSWSVALQKAVMQNWPQSLITLVKIILVVYWQILAWKITSFTSFGEVSHKSSESLNFKARKISKIILRHVHKMGTTAVLKRYQTHNHEPQIITKDVSDRSLIRPCTQ